MAGKPLGVGLVGFGSIAEHAHLPAWHAIPGIEVVAVADIALPRLDLARRLLPSATLFDSPEELVRLAEVDVVDICTPPNLHADLILAACGRGVRDIVCEKPLVLSEDEYARVARARETSGSRVISVDNWRYSDLNRHVQAVLGEGTIGPVREVELRIGRPDIALGNEGWLPRWRVTPEHAGGGIILDHGWHQFYLLMGWMGEPLETISATTRTADQRHFPVEDEALIDLCFPGGRGRIELSWTASGRVNGGAVRGERGTITARDEAVVVETAGGRRELPFAGRLSESSYHPDWFEAMFTEYVIDNDGAPEDNFAEAGALVSAICAAYRSAREQGVPQRPLPLAN